MEKDKIFFNESGLTTTSANHVANLAKEAVETLVTSVEGIQFYETKLALLGSEKSNIIELGTTPELLDSIKPKLMEIAQYKSLIAWLREAIKAKERLILEAKNLLDEEIIEKLKIETPERPSREEDPSISDIVATWNIKQRNRYYYLETVCATIGTYIHPHGKFSEERKDLKDKLNNPNRVSGSGRDTVLYTYTPTVSQTKVDNIFFDLQKTYREYQAELNSMKHSVNMEIEKIEREHSAAYNIATANYKDIMMNVNAQVNAYRQEAIEKAQNLKITIPDSLKEIFSKVNGR